MHTLFYAGRRFFYPRSLPAVFFIVLFMFTGLLPEKTEGQYFPLLGGDRYELSALPDVWFNEVDGVILGFRFFGEDPRTFLDGPHRLQSGVWLGTRLPDSPVSYRITYTHPIAAISEVNSEGAIRAVSSIRTGFHQQEAGIQKRWQPGLNEYVSTDLHAFAGFYRLFDEDYLLFPFLWQYDPAGYLRSNIRKRNENSLGRWTIALTALSGIYLSKEHEFLDYSGQTDTHPGMWGVEGLFGQAQLEAMQQIAIYRGFFLRTRVFAGASSLSLPQEHRYLPSYAPAFHWMASAFTRARGTIPESWIKSGWIHIPGGPGLRGYARQSMKQFKSGEHQWIQHALSWNLDFYYPNPVNALFSSVPYLGDVLKLESYLFTDAGLMYENDKWQGVKANSGAGFMLSLNMPDYLGQDRGFFLRYELPLWVSEPEDDESSFSIRHLFGLGAHYRF